MVIDEIAKLGQRALPAFDDLVKATADADPRARWHAARAIGLIGEDAIAALPTLVTMLKDPDPIVVAQSAAAIGMVRADDGRKEIPAADLQRYEATIQPLLETFAKHADPRARRSAIRALRIVHPDVKNLAPLLCEQLDDADPSVVLPAIQTLVAMEEAAVPVLTQALADPKARYWAEVALGEIGPKAAAAVPDLVKIAAEGELDARLQAVFALGSIGEPAADAVPELVKALESNEELLRFAAAFALGKIRSPAADEALERADDSSDEFLGSIAAWARARIHPDDKPLVAEALERLRKGLAASNPMVRKGSASGLSDLEKHLDDAERKKLAAEFAEMLDDPDPTVGQTVGGALVRLGEAAVDEMRVRLAQPAHRAQALEVLSAVGVAAKPAVPDLVAALADADPAYRGDAAAALAAIGPDAAAAVPELVKLLADGSPPEVRFPAAYALGRIGRPAEAALPRLMELAKSEDEIAATVATWAALKIDPTDASLFDKAIPLLRKALRGTNDLARLEAAVALGDIGAAAATAEPLLELVSEEDPLPSVRAAAAEALVKIRAK